MVQDVMILEPFPMSALRLACTSIGGGLSDRFLSSLSGSAPALGFILCGLSDLWVFSFLMCVRGRDA